MTPKTRKPLQLSRETVRILQDPSTMQFGPETSEGRAFTCACETTPVTSF